MSYDPAKGGLYSSLSRTSVNLRTTPFSVSVNSLDKPVEAGVGVPAPGEAASATMLSSGTADASSLTSTVDPGGSDDIATASTMD
jgi:hypothetical protein